MVGAPGKRRLLLDLNPLPRFATQAQREQWLWLGFNRTLLTKASPGHSALPLISYPQETTLNPKGLPPEVGPRENRGLDGREHGLYEPPSQKAPSIQDPHSSHVTPSCLPFFKDEFSSACLHLGRKGHFDLESAFLGGLHVVTNVKMTGLS